MAYVKHYDSRRNVTYVYESFSYWDKELKAPRSKRKLIGKLDPETGEIVPTAGRGRPPKSDAIKGAAAETAESVTDYRSMYMACAAQVESLKAENAALRNELMKRDQGRKEFLDKMKELAAGLL